MTAIPPFPVDREAGGFPRNRRRVSLILEGSHPSAPRAPANWVRQIAQAMPDIDFALHVVSDRPHRPALAGDHLPRNVAVAGVSALTGPLPASECRPGSGSRKAKRAFLALLREFAAAPDPEARFDALCEAAWLLRESPGACTFADLTGNEAVREFLVAIYRERFGEVTFVRFQETIRDILAVVWRLLLAAGTLPPAGLYHCVGTGYAGVLGALAARLRGAPLLISERGVSFQERAGDIRGATALAAMEHRGQPAPDPDAFRSLWIAAFELFRDISYRQAEWVTALTRGNAQRQADWGADPRRLVIIPQGIDTQRFASHSRHRLGGAPAVGPVTIGFPGPLLPAMDIRTLLHAAGLVLERHPGTRFLIAGSEHDDAGYHGECLGLARQLGIEENCVFPGAVPADEFLRASDIVLLTNRDEGASLALLQAGAAGVPVVATEVAASREILVDRLPSSRDPGPGGIIVEAGQPVAVATALGELITSPHLRRTLGANGHHRVEAAHRREDIASQYRYLYNHMGVKLAAQPALPEAPVPVR